MDANVGDRIVVRGHRTGRPVRACLVLEVRGSGGGAPYLVRWDDSGEEPSSSLVATLPSSTPTAPAEPAEL
jgi:hypothetical protein